MTSAEMKHLLAEQNTALVNAMIATNQPINQRLDNITDRVDELAARVREQNGRVGKGEVAVAESIQKIRNLEREVFNRRSSDREPSSDEQRRVTWLHVRLVLAGGAAMLAIILFLKEVVPLVGKLAQP